MIDVVCTGSVTDLIYSLCAIKDCGRSANYYCAEEREYLFLQSLMETQKYIAEFKLYRGEEIDINFGDICRLPNVNFNPVVESCRELLHLPHMEGIKAWITLPEKYLLTNYRPYSIVNRSLQYHDDNDSWIEKVDYLSKLNTPLFFVGFKEEYDSFCANVAEGIIYLACNTALDMALLIKNAVNIYAGPGFVLALAQALGRPVEVEVDRHRDITYLLQ